jgi:hypothetical protein
MRKHYYDSEGDKMFFMCEKCSLYPDYNVQSCANCTTEDIERRKSNRAAGEKAISHVLENLFTNINNNRR